MRKEKLKELVKRARKHLTKFQSWNAFSRHYKLLRVLEIEFPEVNRKYSKD